MSGRRGEPPVLPVVMLVALSGVLGYAAGMGATRLIELANGRVPRMLEGPPDPEPLARISLLPLVSIESATATRAARDTSPSTTGTSDRGSVVPNALPLQEPRERVNLAAAHAVPPSYESAGTTVPETLAPTVAAPAVSPAPPRISRDQVRGVQRELTRLGF